MQQKANTAKDAQTAEQILNLPVEKIRPFDNHPFRVNDDDELMQQTIDSIMQVGVLNPVIVRPMEDGGYQMVSGHRRLRACELAGIATIPAIARELNDYEAVHLMVDSNIQRENILPSERAKAYRMKMDALKHQGKAAKQTSSQIGTKLRTDEQIAREVGSSRNQVQRFIRLTELLPELLDMVDRKEIAFSPAVELSYLKEEEQRLFLEAMDYSQATPSLSQAQRIKKLSQQGACTQDALFSIMSEEKKSDMDKLTIKQDVLRKYFPKSYTPLQMQQTIIKLLEQWQKRRQRENSR
ncbi:MAG: ParB/RepB/Spo0J family partition protein [Erysipelotrichaceae bacterium]|jgi:ParB family chromosome partitioning protein|nr:ParB/RepB/Spo0J family partition protein [Erysipelotrichaceae bacterium]MCI1327103.1 ParB/RepB/Spo0J family partition protein [Solobacterium sp.]MCH4044282.1 ParB/RepB/Spo0J family partition protein [Erysipelotrichaceae bacterium]MCH4121496.1 ParB/RepB/Spo0J family partition protein [Erysipelotrichaceae bacterium]MCI1363808.1 ParB/RepB/Spo0J family partition protein [Solobacterium sp.]